jgi:mannitol-1-/sugar-/sorbitol-6-phosphatase
VIEFYLKREINLEIQTAAEAKACPGAREFLDILDQSAKWAIVTSASKTVTAARLSAASLPMPPVIVAAEDVTRGNRH